MGSIGIIFLDYSAKSKIFNLPKHIQLLRCGPLLRASPLTPRLTPIRRPAIRWSVASALAGRSRIRGSLRVVPRLVAMASGMDPICSIAPDTGAEVVETRRLELLTLSLQRRCSTS